MSTTKRIAGDYNIISVDATVDNVNITTNSVNITGNLKVAGNVTYIDVTELNVTDPFILLNSSNTASYSANSGVLTHITANTFAGIRYSDDSGVWEVNTGDTDDTGETGTWTQLATGNVTVPGSNTEVIFNNNSSYGANANFTFDFANSKLALDGQLLLGYIATPGSFTANTATMYANTPGSGGTGIYFENDSNQDELISKSKAIVFSIIF